MSVATHLGISLDEYDARIRTFIPNYEEMLDAAGAAVPPDARLIVDLGTGTGALATRCLARAPRARLVAIDADPEILQVASTRLGSRARVVAESFLSVAVPACDVVAASFALHHVRTRSAKARLYRRIARALRRGGRCLVVDCLPARARPLATAQMAGWASHLRHTYTAAEARRLLAAWRREDVYIPLEDEIGFMAAAGLRVEVVWRKGAFAVLAGLQ